MFTMRFFLTSFRIKFCKWQLIKVTLQFTQVTIKTVISFNYVQVTPPIHIQFFSILGIWKGHSTFTRLPWGRSSNTILPKRLPSPKYYAPKRHSGNSPTCHREASIATGGYKQVTQSGDSFKTERQERCRWFLDWKRYVVALLPPTEQIH